MFDEAWLVIEDIQAWHGKVLGMFRCFKAHNLFSMSVETYTGGTVKGWQEIIITKLHLS